MPPPKLPERRTLQELQTLYTLEPSVRDIIVEGRTDRRLIGWYLREHRVFDARVYAVDDRIDPQELTISEPGPGKRDYVAALAERLGPTLGDLPNLTCIIDSDHDAFGATASTAHLLRTDFGSMDVYAFQERPLQQMLSVGLGRDSSASSLIESATPLLAQLAVVRRALGHLGVPLISRFERTFAGPRFEPRLDAHELVRRSLSARQAISEFDSVLAQVERFTRLIPGDPRQIIRGHDIPVVLSWILQLRGDQAKPETLESMMRTSLQVTDLDPHPLFQTVLRRVSS